MMGDWREGDSCMRNLIWKLHQRQAYTDITLKLPDGSLFPGHKLILAIASPFFEAQFYGLLALHDQNTMDIQDVDTKSFQRLLDFIYKSEAEDWNMERLEFWNLLHAANMYLVPGLINHCTEEINDFIKDLTDPEELVVHVNKASSYGYSEEIYKTGIVAIKKNLKHLVKKSAWGKVHCDVVLDIAEDENLDINEGDVFMAMVDWCKANTSSFEESVKLFQEKFAEKVMVKNISQNSFINVIGSSNYLSADMFRKWTFDVMRNKTEDATRLAINPLKIIQTTIAKKDFLEPRSVVPVGPFSDYVVWKGESEFYDVDLEVKIYQKISEGIHVPKGKFGMLLEVVHSAKGSTTRDAITERVSVKMVAKKQDGTIVKKLFKPVEDNARDEEVDGVTRKTNIFVLSKNRDERLLWTEMEVVVIIDRRTTCNIKAISGEDYSVCVSTSATQAYLDKAVPFEFEVGTNIADAVKRINTSMGQEVPKEILTQWLYVFTKGFVGNLRSRRALPNDYWTAKTMEDFLRCKVINFPIGVMNESRRKDAFETWVVARKVTELNTKERDKKNLFVCSYNPKTQEVKYVRNICVTVETKVETLGLMEHMNLGTLQVTDEFLNHLCFGLIAMPSKMFIRRVFPVQDESNPQVEKLVVSEIVKGKHLTHIDDCHVIVLQEDVVGMDEDGLSMDYDEFIIKQIRQIKVDLEPRGNIGPSFQLTMDPDCLAPDVIARLSQVSSIPISHLSIFECYSGNSMVTRPAEFPVHTTGGLRLGQMFDNCKCKEKQRTLFYESQDNFSFEFND